MEPPEWGSARLARAGWREAWEPLSFPSKKGKRHAAGLGVGGLGCSKERLSSPAWGSALSLQRHPETGARTRRSLTPSFPKEMKSQHNLGVFSGDRVGSQAMVFWAPCSKVGMGVFADTSNVPNQGLMSRQQMMQWCVP